MDYIQEFERCRNIGSKKGSKILLENWLNEKKYILSLYEKFLETMDFIPKRGVLEFNSSEINSILPYIENDAIGISLSNKGKDERLYNKVVSINGSISISKNDVYLNYCDKKRLLNFINFYVSDLYYDDLEILKRLISCNKNVFIGVNGKVDDLNYQDNLKKLYELKKEIEIYTGKNIDGEITYISDYYLSAITPKMKYKKQ